LSYSNFLTSSFIDSLILWIATDSFVSSGSPSIDSVPSFIASFWASGPTNPYGVVGSWGLGKIGVPGGPGVIEVGVVAALHGPRGPIGIPPGPIVVLGIGRIGL